MIINWQDVFYFTASLVMIAALIVCIWLMRLFYTASKLINNLKATAYKWSNTINDIRYFKKNVKLKFLSFLLQILDKGGQNEQS